MFGKLTAKAKAAKTSMDESPAFQKGLASSKAAASKGLVTVKAGAAKGAAATKSALGEEKVGKLTAATSTATSFASALIPTSVKSFCAAPSVDKLKNDPQLFFQCLGLLNAARNPGGAVLAIATTSALKEVSANTAGAAEAAKTTAATHMVNQAVKGSPVGDMGMGDVDPAMMKKIVGAVPTSDLLKMAKLASSLK
jgi:hypothetical protein